MSLEAIGAVAHQPKELEADLSRLRQAAGRAVGSAFYGTLLKTMRESPFKGQYGHGGRGEEAFAAQLHGIFAERLGERENGGIADALYRRLEAQQQRLSRGGES